jgi:anhydro-N-acetylmuramic acid kinase
MKNNSYTSDSIFIGLMSGTSVDGIDAVAVSFDEENNQPKIHATHSHPISEKIKSQIIELNTPSENELHKAMVLDQILGELFAEATLKLLEKAKLKPENIEAIGSHGQTIRHQIKEPPFYTLQIGNANIIAERTGITTVSDFRTRDMVLGGQGAPLVPAFHEAIFKSDKNRIIINIGGMANLTLLWGNNKPTQGFDTGPGNVLMDMWIKKCLNKDYDENGNWAKTGTSNQPLLTQLLDEHFLKQKPPKSTGRDLFNNSWLNEKLKTVHDSEENIQATLLAFTYESIAKAIEAWGPRSGEIYVCGGGASNEFLMSELLKRLTNFNIKSAESLGIDPNWVEACAFAWLAKQTLEGKAGNLPSVTGANKSLILGGIYL